MNTAMALLLNRSFTLRASLAFIVLVSASIVVACGDETEESDTQETATSSEAANAFGNGGFEDASASWFSLSTDGWGPFELRDNMAHTGERSARLRLRDQPDYPSFVHGVVQEPDIEVIPEVLSGYYYVSEWVPDGRDMYLQVAVIATGTDLPGGYGNHQLRFVLAGIDKPPFEVKNAKFVFLGGAEPAQDEWTHFSIDLREAFEERWGAVPQFDNLRILFELRYDNRVAGSDALLGEAYYDDLYLGPAPER